MPIACCPQFAKRGKLEEYPDEDDYQDWASEDGEEDGTASPASAAQVRPGSARLRPGLRAASDA